MRSSRATGARPLHRVVQRTQGRADVPPRPAVGKPGALVSVRTSQAPNRSRRRLLAPSWRTKR